MLTHDLLWFIRPDLSLGTECSPLPVEVTLYYPRDEYSFRLFLKSCLITSGSKHLWNLCNILKDVSHLEGKKSLAIKPKINLFTSDNKSTVNDTFKTTFISNCHLIFWQVLVTCAVRYNYQMHLWMEKKVGRRSTDLEHC